MERVEDIYKELSVDFIIHHSKHDEYNSIRMMTRDGLAFARACIYHKDKNCICLSDLYVDESIRYNGIGLYLQEARERIGVALGCDTSFLSVESNSWMFDWYESRGYEYYMDDVDGFVFMIKKLS